MNTLFRTIADLVHPEPNGGHQVYVIPVVDPDGKRSTIYHVHWLSPGAKSSLIVGNHASERLAGIRRSLIEHTLACNQNIRTWDELDAILGLSMVVSG